MNSAITPTAFAGSSGASTETPDVCDSRGDASVDELRWRR